MTVLHQISEGQSAEGCVAIVETPEALDTFVKPHCAAAILRRSLPRERLAWLSALEVGTLPRGRITLPTQSVREAMHQLCDISQMPAGAQRDWLCEDIAALAQVFSEVMGARYVKLRVDVVSTNACRKFHVDALAARLVCTYRGTGTQYGIATQDADPERIFTVPTGVPILLRGSLWPEDPPSGLRHRSPPIEGTGETRLVLVLDPVIEPRDLQ